MNVLPISASSFEGRIFQGTYKTNCLQNNLKKPADNSAAGAIWPKNGYFGHFYPFNISFRGSQNTPLTDEDYNKAKDYFNNRVKEIEAKSPGSAGFIKAEAFDPDKLNGLQKGIEVFSGLTMREILKILNEPIILLNRGCNNACAHCGFSGNTRFKPRNA